MKDGAYRFDPIDVDDVDEIRDHYQAIGNWLVDQTERDVRHHLPNLVEAVAEASNEPETVRFTVGVSFTQNHTPLDYMLERYFTQEDVDFLRRDPMKLPVSQDHHYVSFIYPRDPTFDAAALRSVLLSSIETVLFRLEEEDQESPRTALSDLWQEL